MVHIVQSTATAAIHYPVSTRDVGLTFLLSIGELTRKFFDISK